MKKILWVLGLGIFLLFPAGGPRAEQAEKTRPAEETAKENPEWWDEFDQGSDWGALEADKEPKPEPASESFNQTEEESGPVKKISPIPAAVRK